MRSSVLIGALLAAFFTASSNAQQRPAARNDADWPMYRHDLAGTGYSRLTQITSANVARLTQAWTYRLQSDAAPAAASGTRWSWRGCEFSSDTDRHRRRDVSTRREPRGGTRSGDR